MACNHQAMVSSRLGRGFLLVPLNLFKASIPPNIQIRQRLENESMARVNPAQIHQVLVNLCKNAVQAM